MRYAVRMHAERLRTASALFMAALLFVASGIVAQQPEPPQPEKDHILDRMAM